MSRLVAWFSAGAASAVAAKLALAEADDQDVHVVYTDPGSEHPDNVRFIADCERWYGQSIEVLRSEKYTDTWNVWERARFLASPYGAPCTGELKKKLRFSYQQPDDVHVFGFTADKREIARAERLRASNPELSISTPLIEHGLTKKDCWGILNEVGIPLPAMYRLGYENNNCIGCVKGGMGYWNKIRRDFPDVFQRMSELETQVGATVLRDRVTDVDPTTGVKSVRSIPLPLVDLAPDRGNYRDEPNFECGLLCVSTVEGLSDGDHGHRHVPD